jgi:dTDP-4-dehydrorhamnose 3,5-epimerase-like enzyme
MNIISGGISLDDRGQIRYVNEFDMSLIKRFYIIKNRDTELIRGWRGHKIEHRWFYVLSGTFEILFIKIDNFLNTSPDLPIEKRLFSADDLLILHVPNGYATAFRAIEPDSELLVYADQSIEHAFKDNYTWDLNYFTQLF